MGRKERAVRFHEWVSPGTYRPAALNQCSGLERELVRLATGVTGDPVTMLLNLSPELLTETATKLGSEWLWENLVMRTMSSESTKSVTEPVTVTAE